MDVSKRLENLNKLEQIKQHLLDLEKQVSCNFKMSSLKMSSLKSSSLKMSSLKMS